MQNRRDETPWVSIHRAGAEPSINRPPGIASLRVALASRPRPAARNSRSHSAHSTPA